MEIENLLNDIFDKSITIKNTDNCDGIIELLFNLNSCTTLVQDEDLRQWVTDYTVYWMNPSNLTNNIEAFREETSELLIGFRDASAMDFDI